MDNIGLCQKISRVYQLQGLFVPFARVGSGDPGGSYVYSTTNTLDSIEAFIAEDYVQLVATESNVLLY